MEGALLEEYASVGEGSVVHPGRRIPAGQLWAGNPAVYVRDLSKEEIAVAEAHVKDVAALAADHAYQFLPYSTAYAQAEALGVKDGALAAIDAQQAAYEAAVAGKAPAAAAPLH